MAIHLPIFNLIRQIIPSYDRGKGNHLPFFENNDTFSLDWSKSIADSPSGASCLSVLIDFIQGHGFSVEELEDLVVDSRGTTFSEFHSHVSESYGEHAGVAILVRYNANGRVTEFEVLPFESCRLGQPDSNGYIAKIHYNPFFGTREYKGKNDPNTILYDTFNPKAVSKQILEQKDKFRGQVMYVAKTSTISRFYPIHEAYPTKKWMKIENSISTFHNENLDNGLLQPFMLVMKGNPNEPASNPDFDNTNSNERPITVGEAVRNVIEDNFKGAKRIGNLWLQFVGVGEEAPEVVPFPGNTNGDLFVTIDNQATKKITIGWKVPAILANIHEGVSLGGDGNQVRVAVKLMQHRVIRQQKTITDAYKRILSIMETPYTDDVSITPWNPFPEHEVIDDKVWNEMTPKERREWINKNTEIELFEEDDELIEQPALPAPTPQRLIENKIPVAFPDKIRNKIKKTLEFIENSGAKCASKWGMETAARIANNDTMGQREMNRIHKYLKKNLHMTNSVNDSCESIQFNMLGGEDMYEFLSNEIERIKAWLN